MRAARQEIPQGVTQRDVVCIQHGQPVATHTYAVERRRVPTHVHPVYTNGVAASKRSATFDGKAQQLVAPRDDEPDNDDRGQEADCQALVHVKPSGFYTPFDRRTPFGLSSF